MSRVIQALSFTLLTVFVVSGCASAANSSKSGRGRFVKGYMDREAFQGPGREVEAREPDYKRDLDVERQHDEMLRQQREDDEERRQQAQEARERDLERAGPDHCLSCP